MASKRNMYRPAQVQDNVGQRKPRKTLAQGRLITNGGVSQGSVRPTVSQNVSLTETSRRTMPTNQDTSHISNTSINNSQLHQSSLVQGRLEESLFSPRRTVPQVSQPLTPERGPPAYSLDLSDSEYGEENSEYRSRYQKPDEVLCLDASRQTINPDVSEVDVRIGVDKSPVKIVCHSPSRLKHSLQQKQMIHSPDNMKYHSKHQIKQVENVRDDHIEPYTAVQALPMTPPNERRVLQCLPSNLPQPNFSDSGGSEIIDRLDDKLSIVSDDEIGPVKGVTVTNHKVNNEKNKNSKMAPPSLKKEKRPDTAKKKKGRVIPSRYMQAVESKTKTSLSSRLEKSSFDKTSKISRSMETPASAKKTVRKVHRKNVSTTERPHTPEEQSMISTGGKTSTPTMDGSHLSHDMDIDASAIHPDGFIAGEATKVQKGNKTGNHGKTKSRLKKDLHDDLMGQSILSNVSVCNQSILTSKPKQKVDAKSLQQKLDLLYMYNLQWAFLEAKTKKTLHEQEQQAMAQIYGLHEEDEELRKLKADKEQKLARAKHTNMTDHLVEVQRQCLGPVISNLPTLEKQYSNLAYALDTTRHQIPTKDIHLPENENQFLGKLETELLESERVLGEITTVTRKDVPTIIDMGNAIVTMEKAVEGMEDELNKGKELLSATETLTMHECSLRVQDLQLQVQT